MRITVMQIKRFTAAERAQLNGPDGGWDSAPRFSRYANATTFGNVASALAIFAANEYDPIATLEVDSLEDAFEKSNSFDKNWTENEEVTSYYGDGRERSTSVGDVLANPDTGEHWVVAPMGFEKINF